MNSFVIHLKSLTGGCPLNIQQQINNKENEVKISDEPKLNNRIFLFKIATKPLPSANLFELSEFESSSQQFFFNVSL